MGDQGFCLKPKAGPYSWFLCPVVIFADLFISLCWHPLCFQEEIQYLNTVEKPWRMPQLDWLLLVYDEQRAMERTAHYKAQIFLSQVMTEILILWGSCLLLMFLHIS